MHTMEYYLAIKKNEAPATTWVNLEDMLRKDASHEKPHIIQFHLHEKCRIVTSTESRLMVAEGWRNGTIECNR